MQGVVQTVKDWLTPSKWVSPWKDDEEIIVDHTSGGSFTEIPKGKETVIEKREEDNFTMEEESVPFVTDGIEVCIASYLACTYKYMLRFIPIFRDPHLHMITLTTM